ncbi:MAG: hypothetical protein FWF90_09010 [Promicromonosporaceae bacterium]|nr:hypothetical protein [Promicromonosporaceae bacterium]
MTDAQPPRTRATNRAPARPSPAVIRRRRIVVLSGAGLVVVVVALVTAFGWPGYAVPAPLPTPTHTVTAPAPTPTISPVPRTGEQTDLTKALPLTVLALVEQKLENLPAWQDDDQAVESWTLTYADAKGAGATTVTLQVGQWADDSAATAFFTAQTQAAGASTKSGDVTVGGKKVGGYALVPAGDKSVLWWRNGTVVLRAQGPEAVVQQFYSAYPL